MVIILHGPSALAWWISCANGPADYPAAQSDILERGTPTTQTDLYAKSLCPQLRWPLHYLSDNRHYDKNKRWINHTSTGPHPPFSFLKIASGLYIPLPELALLQSCGILSTHQLLKAAGALCGSFFINLSVTAGLGQRPALATRESIASLIERRGPAHGTKQLAALLPHIPEKAASPPEAFLALVLQCPSRLGGYGLPAPILNERITPSQRAQRIAGRATLVPDFLWPEQKVALEFDSDAIHLDRRQIARDASKRLAMNADGYQAISVTSSQIASPTAMASIAQEIARCLGVRFRQRSERFERENALLFNEGSSLDFLFRPLF